MERDLHSRVKGVVAMDTTAVSGAGTDNGNVIDTIGFESMEYFAKTGVVTDAGTVAGTVAVIEESDVVTFGGEETVVPAEETLGSISILADGDDEKVFRMGSIGKKRFQRISFVGTTGSDLSLDCVAVLSHATIGPVAAQSS